MPVVYLVSGANRGIGLGLVEGLAAKPGAIIFAGARDPSSASALQALAKKNPETVHVVKLSSGDAVDNAAVIEQIRKVVGRLDVVIANAGIGKSFDSVLAVPISAMREHWDVNTAGPLVLFQQTFPLIRDSPRGDRPPKFVVISSLAGSIGLMSPNIAAPAYGGSKAAVNFITKAIHLDAESEKIGLVAFPICPGPVETDMVNNARDLVPMLSQLTFKSAGDASSRLLEIVDGATREETGGKFMQLDGTHPW